MSNRARIFPIFAICILLSLASACAGSTRQNPAPIENPLFNMGGHITIGVKTDQPGTGWEDSYGRSGFDIDLANYLADSLHVTPTFVDVPSGERETELEHGSVQLVIATYSITADRQKIVDFAGPYMETSQGVMVRDGYQQIQKAGDLRGKPVCAAKGSTSEAALKTIGIVPVEEPDFLRCVQDIYNDTAVAVSTDQAVLYGYTQKYRDLHVVPAIRIGTLNWYGIGLAKGHQADCKKIEEVLRKFLRDQWVIEFRDELPAAVNADTTWETDFRPDPTMLDQYSCQ